MTTRTKIWLFPAFLYGVFVFWCSPTGGPLSDSEVENITEVLVLETMSGPGVNPDLDTVLPTGNVLIKMLREHQKHLTELVSRQIETAISK